ncbi:MAG: cytidine deaminase [Saprospiraceae bacterium]|nr:cytidine deaminase [Candidatus Vicinibacter proximus]MBL7824332.1 cytidine deaminase [Saprospiraceae bacterium]MCC6843596.1 cytidine deaminase [Saprospiraceae bacterium]
MIIKNCTINFEVVSHGSKLNEEDFQLLESALYATETSYAPYSNYFVGAAIRLENISEIILGSNQENASYPCGICAERTAIHQANVRYPNHIISTVAVVVKNETKYTPSPCGYCRQVLAEQEIRNKKPIRLILGHPNRLCHIFSNCTDLLPLAFQPNHLDHHL